MSILLVIISALMPLIIELVKWLLSSDGPLTDWQKRKIQKAVNAATALVEVAQERHGIAAERAAVDALKRGDAEAVRSIMADLHTEK
jgi:hypothetical protein